MITKQEYMDCAYCGKRKIWPKEFINHYYAECLECYEKRERKRKMWASIVPFIWYIAGSVCFAVGSIISIYRIVKGL